MLRRRRPMGPTESIINGATIARRTNLYASKKLGRSDDQGLWDGDDIHLRQQASFADVGGIRIPATAVVTGIEGGVDSFDKKKPHDDFDFGANALDTETSGHGGIFTSVRMEQSVV